MCRPTIKNNMTKLHQCCTGTSAGNIIYQQLTNGGSTVDKVLQKEDVKILWDFKIQSDKHLAHNIPDIIVVEKKRVWIIDVAIPGDSRIEEKELEKISKYQDLNRKTVGKTSHCSTSSDRIIRCNTKRP